MTTITTGTGRDGNTYWAVRWGQGETQLAICLSEAEAKSVAAKGCSGVAGGCEHCGRAYSFVYRLQFHKGDCPAG